MSDLQTPVPTDAELEILQVLWGKSPETVRYVNDTLNGRRPADWQVGYTTTLKQMQVMLDKGLLTRDIVERNHLYAPAVDRAQTQARVVQDLADLAFDGSASSLVLRALGSGQATAAELAEIKALIEKMEAQQQNDAP